jgi:uncharacterized protein
MAEVTKYPPGTPSWVDLASPDIEGSARFYSKLFGWQVNEAGPVEETGGYRIATLRDKSVAGMSPPMGGEGQPPAWNTYISVDDVDKTTAFVSDNGGQVLMGPMDVMDAGRMAVYMDPTGAVVSAWQPGNHIGAQLVNEPGALSWNELATRDVDRAKEFYSNVFGWTWQPMDESQSYWMLEVNGRVSGGLMPMGDQFPPEVPNHWMVYFAVADTDASAEKAKGLGATVMVPPTDIPPGRFAALTDPQGAAFTIIKLEQPDGAP